MKTGKVISDQTWNPTKSFVTHWWDCSSWDFTPLKHFQFCGLSYEPFAVLMTRPWVLFVELLHYKDNRNSKRIKNLSLCYWKLRPLWIKWTMEQRTNSSNGTKKQADFQRNSETMYLDGWEQNLDDVTVFRRNLGITVLHNSHNWMTLYFKWTVF